MNTLDDIRKYAEESYYNANCLYDGQNYMTHINLVEKFFKKHKDVVNDFDFQSIMAAIYCHDLIEDARQTWNDIASATNSSNVADIALAVTDVPAKNRFLRGILTLPKIIQDYRAIIIKLCDIYANANYSRVTKSSMYKKYKEEYEYKRPIFKKALSYFIEDSSIYKTEMYKMFNELDELMEYKK